MNYEDDLHFWNSRSADRCDATICLHKCELGTSLNCRVNCDKVLVCVAPPGYVELGGSILDKDEPVEDVPSVCDPMSLYLPVIRTSIIILRNTGKLAYLTIKSPSTHSDNCAHVSCGTNGNCGAINYLPRSSQVQYPTVQCTTKPDYDDIVRCFTIIVSSSISKTKCRDYGQTTGFF